ncbi:MAG TPA: hypothetical protein VMR98_05775 [Candidatus Polarisedimenticolaceae bacterium]|nr:hypothetical protein [Candidatus Polarisedimenticolaceae bacterium]
MRLLEQPKVSFRWAVPASLTLWVAYVYESRAAVALSYLLSIYFLFSLIEKGKGRGSKLLNFSLAYVILIALSLFSVIPLKFLLSGDAPTAQSLFTSYTTILDSLSFHNYAWQGDLLQPFSLIPFFQATSSFYFFIITVIVFLPGIFLWRMREKRHVLFLLLASVIGVFLLKQQNAPLGDLYGWAFDNLPTFNLFRESNKFILFMLPISLLFGFSVAYFSRRIRQPWLRIALALGVACLVLVNIKPIVTREIGTLFVPRALPHDYRVMKDFLVPQEDYFRTYWTPRISRWVLQTNNHPRINASSIIDSTWKNMFGAPGPELTSSEVRGVRSIDHPIFGALLAQASVKYIFVPWSDPDSNELPFQNVDRRSYTSALDRLLSFKRIDIGTKELAVYENTNYMPYVRALSSVYALPLGADVEKYYDFQKSQLKDDELKFIFENPETKSPLTGIKDIFGSIGKTDLKNGTVTKQVDPQNSKIFVNTNKPQLFYETANNQLKLILKNSNNLLLNGQPLVSAANETRTVASVVINPLKRYFVGRGDDLEIIDTKQTRQRDIGTVVSQLQLYSAGNVNLVPNYSLEDGAWKSAVEDCNNYDKTGLIDMSVNSDSSTDGDRALVLESDLHTACTGPNPIAVQSGSEYLFSFDYSVEGGQRAGYEIEFNDANKTLIKHDMPNDGEWSRANRYIKVPLGASELKFRVMGYPDARRKQHAVTSYDDFELTPLGQEAIAKADLAPRFNTLDLPKDKPVNLAYASNSYTYKNLIPNPSLEEGFWRKKVGDCHTYDKEPKLAMNLSNERSDGAKSLQLEARSHIACTGPPRPISVNESSVYLFSFDYQSPNTKVASYYISFNDEARTIISEDLAIEDKGWQQFSKQIKVPYGATSMSLTVYARSPEDGRKIINRYDNFSLVEIPDIADRYYLVNDANLGLQKPEAINFEPTSPTKKAIHVKGAKTPFYLVMGEGYHPKWRLDINNHKIRGANSWVPWAVPDAIASEDHFKYDDFLNGWYVDTNKICRQQNLCKKNPDGSYDIEMMADFTPQRLYQAGMVISGSAFIACLVYLGFIGIRGLNRPKTPSPRKEVQHVQPPKRRRRPPIMR